MAGYGGDRLGQLCGLSGFVIKISAGQPQRSTEIPWHVRDPNNALPNSQPHPGSPQPLPEPSSQGQRSTGHNSRWGPKLGTQRKGHPAQLLPGEPQPQSPGVKPTVMMRPMTHEMSQLELITDWGGDGPHGGCREAHLGIAQGSQQGV